MSSKPLLTPITLASGGPGNPTWGQIQLEPCPIGYSYSIARLTLKCQNQVAIIVILYEHLCVVLSESRACHLMPARKTKARLTNRVHVAIANLMTKLHNGSAYHIIWWNLVCSSLT